MRRIALPLTALAALALLCGCERADRQEAETSSPPPDAGELIDAGVFQPYTAEDYPKLFELLNDTDDIPARIQRAREAAAHRALLSPACPRVTVSEISIDRSTAGNLLAFVYCDPKAGRFDFSERQLARPAAGPPQPVTGPRRP